MSNEIAIFTGHDAIGLEILNQLVPNLIEMEFTPTLYNTGTHKNHEYTVNPLSDFSFYDEHLLDRAVIPFLEASNTSAPNLTYNQLSEKYQIEQHQIVDVNDVRFSHALKGALCIRSKQIFGLDTIKNIKSHTQFFCNLHGGLLPDYRGILSAVWAKANNEKYYGWSLHDISDDGRIDAGQTISSCLIEMPKGNDIRSIYTQMIPESIKMVCKAISRDIPYPLTSKSKGHYYSFPTQEKMDSLGLVYCTTKQGFEYYMSQFAPHSNREAFQNLIKAEIHKYEKTFSLG